MATANTPMIIPRASQEGLIEFHKQCYLVLNQQWNMRSVMRDIDLAYMRENDFTKVQAQAKAANAYGDSTRLQNVTIPVIMPQVEAAVEYQTSVFLTGSPLFGVVASPTYQDEALQMETVIDQQATYGGWSRQFQLFFRDNFKYNIAFVEVVWDRQKVAILETDASYGDGKQGKPKETIWEGNCVKRLDPYNTFWDTRVFPADLASKGEFAGYTEMMGRVALKQFLENLPDVILENKKAAFQAPGGAISIGGTGTSESYYMPDINASALANVRSMATTDWLAWARITDEQHKIEYKNLYEVTTLYARIIPSDFKLPVPSRNTPQIWKFIYINHSVLVYAERQTNAHNNLPILGSQALEDGLGYQTKSLATNVKPLQEVASALMNSVIAARRRAISDRALYDPSRVAEHHINSDNPSAKIPVRPSAYGKNVSEAVYQFPFRDDNSQIALSEIELISTNLANRISGSNPAKQGQFVKGNKTRKEFSDIMTNSNGRDQMTALLLETQIFTPLKTIVSTNILQYVGAQALYNKSKARQVEIDPVALRKAVLEFKVSDGLIPSEKLIDGDTFAVALQVMGSTPAIGAGYNVTPMFSYLMKTQGANLKEFEKSPEQVAYEGALQAWQGTTMAITEAMIKNLKGVEGMTVEKIAQTIKTALPPQPDPKQFNYNPAESTNNSASGAAKQPQQVQQ